MKISDLIEGAKNLKLIHNDYDYNNHSHRNFHEKCDNKGKTLSIM